MSKLNQRTRLVLGRPLRQAVLLNAFHYTHGADSCAAPPAGGAFWGGVVPTPVKRRQENEQLKNVR